MRSLNSEFSLALSRSLPLSGRSARGGVMKSELSARMYFVTSAGFARSIGENQSRAPNNAPSPTQFGPIPFRMRADAALNRDRAPPEPDVQRQNSELNIKSCGSENAIASE